MQLDDFFVKGYYTEVCCNNIALEFSNYDFTNCNSANHMQVPEQVQQRLDSIHLSLADNYVSKIFTSYELLNNGLWDGVDSGSSDWHNDQKSRGFNSNILVYIDDNRVYNNYIMVTNGAEEFKIQPQSNQLVWLNQSSCFKHKAIHTSGPRRLLSFEFFVEGLN
tara:strand:- start:254 stop:745 length:492 start_codon:yes stop_codon:yes gene_type:complete